MGPAQLFVLRLQFDLMGLKFMNELLRLLPGPGGMRFGLFRLRPLVRMVPLFGSSQLSLFFVNSHGQCSLVLNNLYQRLFYYPLITRTLGLLILLYLQILSAGFMLIHPLVA